LGRNQEHTESSAHKACDVKGKKSSAAEERFKLRAKHVQKEHVHSEMKDACVEKSTGNDPPPFAVGDTNGPNDEAKRAQLPNTPGANQQPTLRGFAPSVEERTTCRNNSDQTKNVQGN